MTQNSISAGRALALIPPPALAGEVIAPGDASVRIVCAPHPLKTETIEATMPAGLSIAEIMAACQPREILRRFARVSVGDWHVPRDLWRAVRPKPGTLVTIRMVPQGGGGSTDILRIVLLIAVLAFTVIAPIAFPGALFTIGGVAFSIGTVAGIGVGIPLGRPLLTLEPPRKS